MIYELHLQYYVAHDGILQTVKHLIRQTSNQARSSNEHDFQSNDSYERASR